MTSDVSYLFWYQWKEATYGYTLVANTRIQGYKTDIGHFVTKISGGCNDVLQKMAWADDSYFI